MKRKEPASLDQIIKRMKEASGMKDIIERHSAESGWARVVGPHIASYTGRLYLEGRTLHVYITSAPMKEELGYAKDAIRDKINELVGSDVITNIALH